MAWVAALPNPGEYYLPFSVCVLRMASFGGKLRNSVILSLVPKKKTTKNARHTLAIIPAWNILHSFPS